MEVSSYIKLLVEAIRNRDPSSISELKIFFRERVSKYMRRFKEVLISGYDREWDPVLLKTERNRVVQKIILNYIGNNDMYVIVMINKIISLKFSDPVPFNFAKWYQNLNPGYIPTENDIRQSWNNAGMIEVIKRDLEKYCEKVEKMLVKVENSQFISLLDTMNLFSYIADLLNFNASPRSFIELLNERSIGEFASNIIPLLNDTGEYEYNDFFYALENGFIIVGIPSKLSKADGFWYSSGEYRDHDLNHIEDMSEVLRNTQEINKVYNYIKTESSEIMGIQIFSLWYWIHEQGFLLSNISKYNIFRQNNNQIKMNVGMAQEGISLYLNIEKYKHILTILCDKFIDECCNKNISNACKLCINENNFSDKDGYCLSMTIEILNRVLDTINLIS